MSVRTGGLASLLTAFESFTSISSCFLTPLPPEVPSMEACDAAWVCRGLAPSGRLGCRPCGLVKARRRTRRLELEEVHGLICRNA